MQQYQHCFSALEVSRRCAIQTEFLLTYLLTYFLFNSSNVSIILNVSKYVTSTLTHTVSLFLSSSNSLYDAASYKIRTDVKD